jgi:hypothetical protein
MNEDEMFSKEYISSESTELIAEDQEPKEDSGTETTTIKRAKTEKGKIDPDNPLYMVDKPRRVVIRAKAIHD